MREAVYNCIPKSQLRALHLKYAELVQKTKESRHSNLLAYHFYRANSWKKGFYYSLQAAAQAFREYALTECAEYFQQCASIINDGHGGEIDSEQKLEFYANYSEFLVLEGHYGEAYRILATWRKLGKTEGKNTRLSDSSHPNGQFAVDPIPV